MALFRSRHLDCALHGERVIRRTRYLSGGAIAFDNRQKSR